MYIENYDFKEWMQKLFDKLDELCKDVRALRNADKVLPEDDNLLIIRICACCSRLASKLCNATVLWAYYLTLQSAEKCITGLRTSGNS